jgi:hypothetical protein
MIGLFCFALAVVTSPFRSKLRLEAENGTLRLQLIVLRRKLRGRVRLTNHDRWFFVQLYRWFPSIVQVLKIIRPETLVRWMRQSLAQFSGSESSPRIRSLADFITTTSAFRFFGTHREKSAPYGKKRSCRTFNVSRGDR